VTKRQLAQVQKHMLNYMIISLKASTLQNKRRAHLRY